MLIIENRTNISYTKGDTFNLEVRAMHGFKEGSTLRLTVALKETTEPIISNVYSLGEDGKFLITLDEDEREMLPLGDYIYKITLIDEQSTIITQKSGKFMVKWGA